MHYKKEIFQAEADSLIGESIKNVFYYTEYEGYEIFKQLSDEIVEVFLLGILLETSSGNYYNIISHDYAPYYGLGGIQIFRNESLRTSQGRPNQINEVFWNCFRKKQITNAITIESHYKKAGEELTIPFGLKIIFEGEEECYIMNMSIEGFIEDGKIYDFCRGGGLVLFAGKDAFTRSYMLDDDTILF